MYITNGESDLSLINCIFCCEPTGTREKADLSFVQTKDFKFEGQDITFKIQNNTTGRLESGSMKSVATVCNHVFHEGCLKKWILTFKHKTSTPNCPTCRTVLGEADVIIQENVQAQFYLPQQQAGGLIFIDPLHTHGVDLIDEAHANLTIEVIVNEGSLPPSPVGGILAEMADLMSHIFNDAQG